MDLSIYILIDSNSNKEKSFNISKTKWDEQFHSVFPVLECWGEKVLFKVIRLQSESFFDNHCCTPYCP